MNFIVKEKITNLIDGYFDDKFHAEDVLEYYKNKFPKGDFELIETTRNTNIKDEECLGHFDDEEINEKILSFGEKNEK